jgi:hypothetical protein
MKKIEKVERQIEEAAVALGFSPRVSFKQVERRLFALPNPVRDRHLSEQEENRWRVQSPTWPRPCSSSESFRWYFDRTDAPSTSLSGHMKPHVIFAVLSWNFGYCRIPVVL